MVWVNLMYAVGELLLLMFLFGECSKYEFTDDILNSKLSDICAGLDINGYIYRQRLFLIEKSTCT